MCCRRRNRMSPNLVGCFSRIPSHTLFILLARGASCLPPLGNLLFLFSQACVKVVDYRTTCGRLYKPDKWICPINFRRRSVKNSCRCIGAAWLGSRRLVCSKCELWWKDKRWERRSTTRKPWTCQRVLTFWLRSRPRKPCRLWTWVVLVTWWACARYTLACPSAPLQMSRMWSWLVNWLVWCVALSYIPWNPCRTLLQHASFWNIIHWQYWWSARIQSIGSTAARQVELLQGIFGFDPWRLRHLGCYVWRRIRKCLWRGVRPGCLCFWVVINNSICFMTRWRKGRYVNVPAWTSVWDQHIYHFGF